MHRKLYFMLPNIHQCKQLVTDLRTAGIHDHHIHVIARDDVPLDDLNKASLLEKTELKHGLELGISVGGIAGMLAGLLAVTFPPAGVALGGGAAIFATTLAGAGFGSLVSALVARDIPNHELAGFHARILEGHLLLILDVPTKQVDEIIELIKNTHPEVKIDITRPKKA